MLQEIVENITYLHIIVIIITNIVFLTFYYGFVSVSNYMHWLKLRKGPENCLDKSLVLVSLHCCKIL